MQVLLCKYGKTFRGRRADAESGGRGLAAGTTRQIVHVATRTLWAVQLLYTSGEGSAQHGLGMAGDPYSVRFRNGCWRPRHRQECYSSSVEVRGRQSWRYAGLHRQRVATWSPFHVDFRATKIAEMTVWSSMGKLRESKEYSSYKHSRATTTSNKATAFRTTGSTCLLPVLMSTSFASITTPLRLPVCHLTTGCRRAVIHTGIVEAARIVIS